MRDKVDICDISETHWKDQGHFHTEHHNIYMSGGANRGRNGVAFLVSRRIAQTVHSYEPINDRIIKITLAARPRNLHLVGKVEEAHLRGTGGAFGLGVRNEREERLIQFAVENDLAIMNTMFQHHPRRLSTWISPNKEYRNQIDYMMIKKRWRTSIRNVKAKPGADCDSDHKLLLGAFSIKLHFLKRGKKQEMTRIGNMEAFQQNLMNNADWGRSDDPNKYWKNIKEWIKGAVRESRAIKIRKKKH
ncbi:craniofacial development protein 2-like [Temnothorax curvispinosus]|uniref:Craniofacial development protein 2-like n=1 Tax=Temnothorax curvispinosus TaxID=300111 RepID=A0A6J1PK97_9HYME|nr:craniofacial development protein 2-like [Temnothorax curvispinosus]